ncbi:unnamed protein product [Macrosiphum euphorbiae]|nr:unnamed protein product [Macrosiphum euphorbiae]
MRLNIKQHRQKLLQYLENTNDTFLKPKIKLISNDIEKSNINHNYKRKTRSSTVKQLPNFQPHNENDYPPTTKRKIMTSKTERNYQNAKERKSRHNIANSFETLRKCCSYLCTNRPLPSKNSILLAAKKECDLLTLHNKKLLENKIYWSKKNEILKSRINELTILSIIL